MNKVLVVMAVLALLCLGIVAQADVFNLGAGFTNLETVRVGDAGNIGDARYGGYGSVSYTYNIGKYEVTAKQYTDFLNAKAKTDTYGLYSMSMMVAEPSCKIKRSGDSGSYTYSVADDYANRPVNFVSYWDSCRFANWLCNGQGDGDTETGAYTLNGYNGTDGRAIQRNAGATWAVTSEDEWYKAAYYKGGSTNAGYWDYPTQSDTVPTNKLLDPDPGNCANYYNGGNTTIGTYWRANAGEFENSASAYDTFDQGGNVWEWNEAISYTYGHYAYRDLRGGSFDGNSNNLQASNSLSIYPTYESYTMGFRVVQAVPEPSSILAMLGGLVGFGGITLRRVKH